MCAYFGHSSFSRFTACSYFNENGNLNKYPITITSEASDHSWIAAFSCLNKVVESIKSKMENPLRKVYVWSEGMSAQFPALYLNASPHLIVPLTWSGTTWKRIMGKVRWMVLEVQLKTKCSKK